MVILTVFYHFLTEIKSHLSRFVFHKSYSTYPLPPSHEGLAMLLIGCDTNRLSLVVLFPIIADSRSDPVLIESKDGIVSSKTVSSLDPMSDLKFVDVDRDILMEIFGLIYHLSEEVVWESAIKSSLMLVVESISKRKSSIVLSVQKQTQGIITMQSWCGLDHECNFSSRNK